MINNIQPNSIVKEDFDNAMRNFCKKVTFNSHKQYKESGLSHRPVYKVAGGRKYLKVKSFETNTVDMDGNSLPGWPITLNGNVEGGIVFSDLDGNLLAFYEPPK